MFVMSRFRDWIVFLILGGRRAQEAGQGSSGQERRHQEEAESLTHVT